MGQAGYQIVMCLKWSVITLILLLVLVTDFIII